MNFENLTKSNKEEELENMEKESMPKTDEENPEKIQSKEELEREVSELKEEDQKKASEEAEKARASIFGKIGDLFKGKEKTEEEKYEKDMKDLEKTVKSLTHVSSSTLELGASFAGGVDKSGVKTEELKNKLSEIAELNRQLKDLDRGNEKVELLRKKKKLIGEFARMGREEIENKYKSAA